VDPKRDGPRRQRRRRLVAALICTLLLVLPLGAQEQTQEAGEANDLLSIRLDPETLTVGSVAIVEFLVPATGLSTQDLVLPSSTEGFRLLPDLRLRSLRYRDDEGELTLGTEVRLEVEALSPGRWVLEGLRLEGDEVSYRVEPAVLSISGRETPGVVPPRLEWRLSEQRPYVGQTVALVLSAVNAEAVSIPETVSVSTPVGAVIESVDGIGRVDSRLIGETELFSFPVATYLFTPTETGVLDLPPATARVRSLTLEAEGQSLPVRDLPPGLSSGVPVGSFVRSLELSRDLLEAGEQFSLRQRIRGLGNLSFMTLPDPRSQSILLNRIADVLDAVPTDSGYQGSRTIEYSAVFENEGTFTLELPELRYLDPRSGRIRLLPGERRRVEVRSVGAVDERGRRGDRLSLLSADELVSAAAFDLYRRPAAYALLLPGPAVVVALLLLRRRRLRRSSLVEVVLAAGLFIAAGGAPFPVERAQQAALEYQEGDFEAAFSTFEELHREFPENPGVLTNFGIIAFERGEIGESVYLLRKAVHLRPDYRPARDALSEVEDRAGLERQLSLPGPLLPDMLFAPFILLWNVAWILIPLRTDTPAVKVIVVSLLFGGVIATAGAGVVIDRDRFGDVSVIGQGDAFLRRIPELEAERWISLPEGTAVSIVSRTEELILVRTSSSVEGWIPDEALVQDRWTSSES
jgi:tetratricopeptide (TPR) repeat protein